jgi:hypothetical protein
MNTLRAYRICTHLLPRDFRKVYGEQMLLTARDALNDPTTASKRRVALGLMLDLLRAACIQNIKQLGESMSKQSKTTAKSALHAAVLGGQVVGIACMSYFYVESFLFVFRDPRPVYTPAAVWYLSSIMPSVALLSMLAIAFIVVRRLPQLTPWSKLTWTYGLGFLGAIGYIGFGQIIDGIGLNSAAGSSTGLSLVYDWLAMILFIGGFYLVTQKLVRNRRTGKSKA